MIPLFPGGKMVLEFRISFRFEILHRNKAKRRGIEAIPQPRGLRAIGKHMAQMRIPVSAADLRTHHEKGAILFFHHVFRYQRGG